VTVAGYIFRNMVDETGKAPVGLEDKILYRSCEVDEVRGVYSCRARTLYWDPRLAVRLARSEVVMIVTSSTLYGKSRNSCTQWSFQSYSDSQQLGCSA